MARFAIILLQVNTKNSVLNSVKNAYSYIGFGTPDAARVDSERRQLDVVKGWCFRRRKINSAAAPKPANARLEGSGTWEMLKLTKAISVGPGGCGVPPRR